MGRGWNIPYSVDELGFVFDNRTLPIGELHAAFVARFGRTDVSAPNLHALRKRKGWKTGRTGRFEKGQPGKSHGGHRHPRSVATRFQKGHLPHNTKWLGHERVCKDGYVEISVAETNPHTGFERRYVLKHLWLWEQKNGPLPQGMCLKCLDGDKTNTDPANWEAIPRALLPRLGGRFGRGYESAPAELKPTIMAVAKLEHAVREKTRPARPARPTGRRASAE